MTHDHVLIRPLRDAGSSPAGGHGIPLHDEPDLVRSV